MSSSNSNSNQDEELISKLTILVKKLQMSVSFHKTLDSIDEDFLIEYINYEDQILSIYEKLKHIKIVLSKEKEMIIKKNFNIFKVNWKDYQDQWNEDIWKKYDELRTSKENVISSTGIYSNESSKKEQSNEINEIPGCESKDDNIIESSLKLEDFNDSNSKENKKSKNFFPLILFISFC